VQRRLKAHRAAYRETFIENTAGKIVLADLEQFCCARTQTQAEDPQVSAFNAGKRDVWLRIQNTLRLTEDDIERIALWAQVHVGGE
jgi:hypothetical protein